MPETRVGISGWRYTPWRGVFYPPNLPQKYELEFASQCMNSLEINGSFYSLQRPSAYQQWYDATPADFIFSVKGSRFITHMKRLQNLQEAQANFWASGVLRLEEKLGPILWQLPPNFQYDKAVLHTFFTQLPQSTWDAAKMALRHSPFLKGRVWCKSREDRRIRYAMEIRNVSFLTEEFVMLLRAHGIALVISDAAKKWPVMEDMTADFVYARLHGENELYSGRYDDVSLDRWARRFRSWRKGTEPREAQLHAPKADRQGGRDIFVYFDNDVKVDAPFDAMSLAGRLGIERDYERIRSAALQTGKPKSRLERRKFPWPRKAV